jgi:hypothetical protein
MQTQIDHFPAEVIEKLKCCVYRLIDPTNGETFYIGKGRGNRVFHHLREERGYLQDYDEASLKIQTIHKIRNAGLEVILIIHRHGMDETTAREVEAALIDVFPGLSNVISGSGSNDYGPMHVQEIITNYSADEAVLDEKFLLINVNRSIEEKDLYQATRFAWRLDVKRAQRAKYIIAVSHGIIRQVFIADRWLEAKQINFPGLPEIPGRFGFIGHLAPQTIQDALIDKRLPLKFRTRGASNPIKYTYK